MSLVCTHCGYENSEHYRFCGMCGAVLPEPGAKAEPASPVRTGSAPSQQRLSPVPSRAGDVSGPSFLGLSDQPKRDVEYLLEDEESHDAGRRRMYAALLLLVIAGGLVLWQSRQGGVPWMSRLRGILTASPTASGPPPQQDNSSQTNGPLVGPTPSTAPAPSMPLASSSSAQNASSTPPPANLSEESHMVKPDENKAPAESDKAETPPTSDKESQTADKAASDDSQNQGEAKASAPKETAQSDEAPAAVAKNSAPPSKPVASKPAPKAEVPQPAPTNSADERLVADGEKYLYGTGTSENCNLAQKNLRAAAAHGNPRALSMLGAMYATGHCVNRDLPTAYRSFARALHQEPDNGRIQRDLEVLWRQMSADERQAAIRNQ